MLTHISKSVSTVSSDDLSKILKYPEAKVTSKLKKLAVNSTSAVCLSDSPVVRQLKEKEEQKRHSAEEKARKKEEREKKKEERERKKLLKEKEEKRKEREIKRGQKGKEKTGTRMPSRRNKKPAADVGDQDEEEGGNGEGSEASNGEEVSDDEGDVECPVCHIHGLSCQWICCDNCDVWYHTHCTDANPDRIPDIFYCFQCV